MCLSCTELETLHTSLFQFRNGVLTTLLIEAAARDLKRHLEGKLLHYGSTDRRCC